MAAGTVKWFNPAKGMVSSYRGRGPDVFVHLSAVQKAGYTELVEGARISYELVPSPGGKMSADNLRLG